MEDNVFWKVWREAPIHNSGQKLQNLPGWTFTPIPPQVAIKALRHFANNDGFDDSNDVVEVIAHIPCCFESRPEHQPRNYTERLSS